MQYIEKTINGAGGIRLFTQRHEIENAKGSVVILHGYCEHCLRYSHVVDHLTEAGYSCYLLDQRGHGRSEGQRAAVLSFSEYLDDMDIYLEESKQYFVEGPVFLLGHSMGGLVAVDYILSRKNSFDGVLLSSPFLGMKVPIPAWKEAMAKLMSRVFPGLSLKSDLDPHLLSHDEAMVQDYISDTNVSKIANARWFTESADSQASCLARAEQWKLPLLVMHGGDDRIADPDASVRFFEKVPVADKQLEVLEGMYHEIFNETDRAKVMDLMLEWIAKHSSK